jgi:hypothetical protein
VKILFLDFDGVLNSHQEVIYHHRYPILRQRVGRVIARFLEKTILPLIYLTPLKQRVRSWWTNFYLFHLTDHCCFCPIACSNVQYVLDTDPDVRIVVSSVWRSWGTRWIKRILARNGIDPAKVIGRTGDWEGVPPAEELGRKAERGDQIKVWLQYHQAKVDGWTVDPSWYGRDEGPVEPVTDFVVLDDDSDMTAVRENFVKVSGQTGVTMFVVYDALRVLRTKKPGAETMFDPLTD